jgi:NifU-like protein involved in Fe-S cluster formation
MYSDRLLAYFREPRRVGTLAPPARKVEEMHPVCGDILRLTVLVAEDRIVDAAFQAKGCTASLAAGEAVANWLVGKPLDEARRISPAIVEELLDGLPAESKHAAVLASDVARKICQ